MTTSNFRDIGTVKPRDDEYEAKERRALLNLGVYAHEHGLMGEQKHETLDLIGMLDLVSQVPAPFRESIRT